MTRDTKIYMQCCIIILFYRKKVIILTPLMVLRVFDSVLTLFDVAIAKLHDVPVGGRAFCAHYILPHVRQISFRTSFFD
jgi:hypothetical protein